MTLSPEFVLSIASIAIVLSTVHLAITAGLVVVMNFMWKSLARIEAKLDKVEEENQKIVTETRTRYHMLEKAFDGLADRLQTISLR